MRKVGLIVGLILLMQLVWVAPSVAAPPAQGGVWYTVRSGETLASISRWYGVNPWAIAAANRVYNLNLIFVGQTLCIPNY